MASSNSKNQQTPPPQKQKGQKETPSDLQPTRKRKAGSDNNDTQKESVPPPKQSKKQGHSVVGDAIFSTPRSELPSMNSQNSSGGGKSNYNNNYNPLLSEATNKKIEKMQKNVLQPTKSLGKSTEGKKKARPNKTAAYTAAYIERHLRRKSPDLKSQALAPRFVLDDNGNPYECDKFPGIERGYPLEKLREQERLISAQKEGVPIQLVPCYLLTLMEFLGKNRVCASDIGRNFVDPMIKSIEGLQLLASMRRWKEPNAVKESDYQQLSKKFGNPYYKIAPWELPKAEAAFQELDEAKERDSNIIGYVEILLQSVRIKEVPDQYDSRRTVYWATPICKYIPRIFDRREVYVEKATKKKTKIVENGETQAPSVSSSSEDEIEEVNEDEEMESGIAKEGIVPDDDKKEEEDEEVEGSSDEEVQQKEQEFPFPK